MKSYHNNKIKIGASLACANLLDLGKEIKNLKRAGIDFLHIDIMDGEYVNNYCFGTEILDFLERGSEGMEIEVHLMVINSYYKLDFFKGKNFDRISFHLETINNPIQGIKKIKSFDKECGIAINAGTNEKDIFYLYDYLDYVLVMSVEAGFNRQDFIKTSINKVKNIRKELDKRNMTKDIIVDGHIDKKTIKWLYDAGANAFIGGSTGLFVQGKTLEENYSTLINAINTVS